MGPFYSKSLSHCTGTKSQYEMIFYGQDGDGSQLDKIGPPFSSKAPELSKKDQKTIMLWFSFDRII